MVIIKKTMLCVLLRFKIIHFAQLFSFATCPKPQAVYPIHAPFLSSTWWLKTSTGCLLQVL